MPIVASKLGLKDFDSETQAYVMLVSRCDTAFTKEDEAFLLIERANASIKKCVFREDAAAPFAIAAGVGGGGVSKGFVVMDEIHNMRTFDPEGKLKGYYCREFLVTVDQLDRIMASIIADEQDPPLFRKASKGELGGQVVTNSVYWAEAKLLAGGVENPQVGGVKFFEAIFGTKPAKHTWSCEVM